MRCFQCNKVAIEVLNSSSVADMLQGKLVLQSGKCKSYTYIYVAVNNYCYEHLKTNSL